MRFLTFTLVFMFSMSAWAESEKTEAVKPMVADPVTASNYFQMIFGLAVVIALIVGLAWFMRRMGNYQSGATGALKVLGGISLGQRERVVLLQAGKTQMLVGIAPGQIRTLHVLDEPIEEMAAGNGNESFAVKLNAFLKQGKQP